MPVNYRISGISGRLYGPLWTIHTIRDNYYQKQNKRKRCNVDNSILYTKVKKFMIIARAPRLEPEACRRVLRREGYKGLLHRGLYTIFLLLGTLKPFLIIIINPIILSDATIRVVIFQRLL
jgi:hypothetical protein